MRAVALLLAIVAAAPAARAEEQNITLGRYEARTIVTGTDMRSRPSGLAACLTDVLIKVSGDPALADDASVPEIAAQAQKYVAGFDYWDRMNDLPHHDDQGSYDRPYNLTARFVPEKIDALLHGLGREPWHDPRPELVPLIHVKTQGGAFDITQSEPDAEDMRAAWLESGQRYGVPIAIPAGTLPAADTIAPPAQVALAGTLEFSETAHGWVGAWRMTWQGRAHAWGISGVNADEAFRQAVRGAMQILSGHGAPD